MSTEPQVRYFLGANSPGGFYSLYDQLIDPAEADAVFILKGGPGCGKSTLMKRLDAILLPEKKTAIVDGTAPHERAAIGPFTGTSI